MKIAQVTPYPLTIPGGVQHHVRDLSRSLRDRGHEVRIIVPATPEVADPDDQVFPIGRIRSIRLNGSVAQIGVVFGAERRRLASWLEDEAFDLIHYHAIWSPFLPFQVLWASKTVNVATFHDSPASGFLGGVVAPAVSHFLSTGFLHGVISVSPAQSRFIRSRFGVDIVPNGVFVDRYATASPGPLERYRDGKLNLLFVGAFYERKGVLQLLEAYARLKPRYPQLRLILVGDGYQMPQVRSRVEDEGLRDVEILGRVDEDTKAACFAVADLVCSPAMYAESFGIVLVEAMAAGKPVVAAANEGYRSVLTGEGAELLYPSGNVEALVARLESLLDDPERRRALGRWGRERADLYDWAPVTDQVEMAYSEAIERFRSSR